MSALTNMLRLLIFGLFIGTSFSGCNEDLLSFIQENRSAIENGNYLPLLKAYVEQNPNLSLRNTSLSNASLEILEQSLESEQFCRKLFDGPPRGLSCLHCTQSEAQGQANIVSLLLERSCLRNIAINYLIDGSFGVDYPFLFSQVAALTSGGRNLHLVLYLGNGPSQRRWKTTKVKSYSSVIEPEDFRDRIKNDPLLQKKFKKIVQGTLPLLYFAKYRGAEIYLVPMLEDNLDNEAFLAMVRLVQSVVPADIGAKIGRNPCSGCYNGNTNFVPKGIFREEHTISTNFRFSGGLVTNDGYDYAMSAKESSLTLDTLSAVRDRAAQTDNIFILWSGNRQGLKMKGNKLLNGYNSPEDRSYKIPSFAERKKIISFLRQGILP